MNLKNQPTVMMPTDIMYDAERQWGMSKAAWMDVAWDLMQQLCICEGKDANYEVTKVLKDRCELIQMYRKRARDAA